MAFESFAEAVKTGLSADQKSLPTWGLYDEVGSSLFPKICRQPEYDLGRAEKRNFKDHIAEFVNHLPPHFVLIEPGAGDATKTWLLIESLLRENRQFEYVITDIDQSILNKAAHQTTKKFGEKLGVKAIQLSFTELPCFLIDQEQPIVMPFLGSTIGNFGPDGASRLLKTFRTGLKSDDCILLGFALERDPKLILAAYNDLRGITRQFILNYLTRINRELGGQFNLGTFQHMLFYDKVNGCVTSSLFSLIRQNVRIESLDLTVKFVKGTQIFVESSSQYSVEAMSTIASDADFMPGIQFSDPAHSICDILLTAV